MLHLQPQSCIVPINQSTQLPPGNTRRSCTRSRGRALLCERGCSQLAPENMGHRNTEVGLILIPLTMEPRLMSLISSTQLGIHHPLSISLFDSITQRCICTGSSRITFISTPLSPSIGTVTPTATTTITVSASMTTTTRTVSFSN
jgi:hypothetical protein